MALVGRFDEAVAESRRAIALDPLSPTILVDGALTLLYAGKTAPALDLARKAAELDPTFFWPATTEGELALQVGNFRGAIAKFEQSRTLSAPPFTTAPLAYPYGMSSDRAHAIATLGELKRISPGGEVAPFNLALVYLGLGDRRRTLGYLEQAYAGGSGAPRFMALMRSLNFLK